jgi:hypothetical protein
MTISGIAHAVAHLRSDVAGRVTGPVIDVAGQP